MEPQEEVIAPKPQGRYVGKKLRLLEISVMHASFGIELDQCQEFLHRIGVPTLVMGGRLWYEESALELVFSELSKVGGPGLGMKGPVGASVCPDQRSGGCVIEAKKNWKFRGSTIEPNWAMSNDAESTNGS